MDWNSTLLWLVGLSAVIFGSRTLLQRPVAWGWAAVLALIAGTAAVGWFSFPDVLGFVLLGEWLVLVLLPNSAMRLAMQLVNSRRSHAARWIVRIGSWLHPADGWSANCRFVDALAALQQGRMAEGRELLASLQNRNSPLGRTATAMLARQSADWSGFLNWINLQPDRDDLLADGSLLDVYLQSLGEVGRRAEMLHEYELRLGNDSHFSAQLRVVALCGDVATTRALLAGPLQSWPREVGDFWIATAQLVRGDPQATAAFARLGQGSNRLVGGLAQRRLIDPLPPLQPGELDAEAHHTLARLHQDALHESRFAVLSSTPYRRPLVTWTIALVLTVCFARELAGGAEDQWNLIEMGALVIPRQPPFDEWWRPWTAAFLHVGWAHFLMNLFGLLFLGVRLERAWGWWRTLVCYSAAILVSMTVTPWLLEADGDGGHILAGASGGIMGLLGGLLGHLLVGRWRRRTPQVAHQLSLLIGFVLLQTLFDLSHVEVSQQAHLLGLATGCTCGLLFGILSRHPQSHPDAPPIPVPTPAAPETG